MANNYRSFSEQIENLTDEEIDWLEHQTDTVFFKRVPGPDPKQEVLEVAPSKGDQSYREEGTRFLVEAVADAGQAWLIDDLESLDTAYFEFALNREDRTLWLYTEESGDMGQVAVLVQQFLRKFRPHECFSLTAADYCSKPRLGEFGGAAVFITSTEIRLMSTWDWIVEQQVAFREATSNPCDQPPPT